MLIMKLQTRQEPSTIMPQVSGADAFWHSTLGYNCGKFASLGPGTKV